MGIVEIVLIAVSLAMDAFAVSLVAGAAGQTRGARPTFRLSFHFGLFQFFMPLIGWALGASVVAYLASASRWIAFGLLVFIGSRMIRSGLSPEEQADRKDLTRGLTLVLVSLATSIDALAVGFSLAMLNVSVWYPCVVIGIVTSILSVIGTWLGSRLNAKFAVRAEIAGGVILVLIGLRILLATL